MSKLHCTVATSERQRAEAARVWHEVYVHDEQMTLAPELGTNDSSESIVCIVAHLGEEPVGTVRLVVSDPELRLSSGRFGLELESSFELSGFEAPGVVLAEVTRFCVRRRFRGTRVAGSLLSCLRLESSRRKVTHWVAAANLETDSAEDAELAYRLVQATQLTSATWRAEPRVAHAAGVGARSVYTPEQRLAAGRGALQTLAVPRTIALFAHKMGARYIGPPAYDRRFGVYALPLAVDLAALRERSLRALPLEWYSDPGTARIANDDLSPEAAAASGTPAERSRS